MKKKILLFMFLCLSSLSVMGFSDDPPQKKGKVQGTITRNSTRKTEPKKQKTEQPAKQNSGKKQTSNNQRHNSKPVSQPTGYVNGHEWVDLGLSVKWATCNVGASSPSEYGDYYAWGETSTKSSYDWSNCFDCLDTTGNSWGTYKLGGQTRISPSSGHDTARENWGVTWRMPTDAENDELCTKCKWTWTSQGGHNGYKVTGPNGNSIFLPAAGYRFGTVSGSVGSYGYYWSGTLTSSLSNFARGLSFGSSGHDTNGNGRRYGRSVRPVTE